MTVASIGIILVLLVLIGAIISAVYEGKNVNNQMRMWKIVANAMGNPAKFLAVGGSLSLLIASILFSVFVGETMHMRMVEVGWVDFSKYLVITLQLVGTVSTYLMPLLLLMMFDTTALKRADFDLNEAKKYSFKTTGMILTVGTVGLMTLLSVLFYNGMLSSAALTSTGFFTICAGLAIAAIIYCYNAKGATNEEVFAFSMSVIFGAGVYALDFHWNQLLTYEIPLSKLDPNMSEELFAIKINEFSTAFSNRTNITIAMILMDIFASALGLLTGELIWLMKLMRFISYNSAQQNFIQTSQQSGNINRTSVNPITNTNPPPPPPPPSGGGNTNPPPGTTI